MLDRIFEAYDAVLVLDTETTGISCRKDEIIELAVLKAYAEPRLFAIEKDCPEYLEAKRLLKFLDYFLPVPAEDIPSNSLLREFIGGSCIDV